MLIRRLWKCREPAYRTGNPHIINMFSLQRPYLKIRFPEWERKDFLCNGAFFTIVSLTCYCYLDILCLSPGMLKEVREEYEEDVSAS